MDASSRIRQKCLYSGYTLHFWSKETEAPFQTKALKRIYDCISLTSPTDLLKKSGIVIQQIKMVIVYDLLQVWNFEYISREVYVIYKF